MPDKSLLYTKINPKNKAEEKMAEKMEELFSKYLLIEMTKELTEEDLTKAENTKFRYPYQVAEFLKTHVPDFKNKYAKLVDKFIEEYVK